MIRRRSSARRQLQTAIGKTYHNDLFLFLLMLSLILIETNCFCFREQTNLSSVIANVG